MFPIVSKNMDNDQYGVRMMSSFFKEFRINAHLRSASTGKNKGVPYRVLFQLVFLLAFLGKNLYRLLDAHSDLPCKKDTVYRFLHTTSINWRSFLLRLSTHITTQAILPLVSQRRTVWVLDTTSYERPRSKKVEGLSRIYDYAQKRFTRGFRLLTLGLTDGATFLPVSFSLLSSRQEGNQLSPLREDLDGRTRSARLRAESREKAPDRALALLREALTVLPAAHTVCCDSWFASPAFLRTLLSMGLSAVCRLKKTSRIFYYVQGKPVTLPALYATAKKRFPAHHLFSVCVSLSATEHMPARILFVHSEEEPGKWIALLSTDITLTEEEILTTYAKRWDIETFFKVTKSSLRLSREFEVRSFDALVAHTTVVFVRYLMLAVAARRNRDQRTLGALFYACCDELPDITFTEALCLVYELFAQIIYDVFHIPETRLKKSISEFLHHLPSWLSEKLMIVMCES